MSDTAVADTVATDTTTTTDAGAPVEAPVVVSDTTTTETTASTETAKADLPAVTYELKLPDASTLEPAVVERTVAFAKARGLSNADAQAALEFANTEVAGAVQASRDAFLAAYQPGDPEKGIAPGAEWQKQHDNWLAASLADPEIGAGKPEQLDAKVAQAQRAFEKYASPEFRALLSQTGYGSHPELVRTFAAIGAAMSEGPLVTAGAQGGSPSQQDVLDKMYPTMVKKD